MQKEKGWEIPLRGCQVQKPRLLCRSVPHSGLLDKNTSTHPHWLSRMLTIIDSIIFFIWKLKQYNYIQLIQPPKKSMSFISICDTVIPVVGRPGQFLCLTLSRQPWPHRSMVQSSSRIKATSFSDVSFLFHFPLISHNNLMLS